MNTPVSRIPIPGARFEPAGSDEPDVKRMPNDIQTRILYGKKHKFATNKVQKRGLGDLVLFEGHFFHRADHNEDGSVSETFGIEIDLDTFNKLSGMTLTDLTDGEETASDTH